MITSPLGWLLLDSGQYLDVTVLVFAGYGWYVFDGTASSQAFDGPACNMGTCHSSTLMSFGTPSGVAERPELVGKPSFASEISGDHFVVLLR